MRFILLTTAAVLTLGSAASANTDPSGAKPDFPATPCNIRMATTDGSNAAGGTGVEESADSKGASPEQGNAGIMPNSGAGSAKEKLLASIPAIKAAPASKLVLRAKVLTNKSGQDLGVPMGSQSGVSPRNATDGTSVETSSQGRKGKLHNETIART
jgi:hypothetical protein